MFKVYGKCAININILQIDRNSSKGRICNLLWLVYSLVRKYKELKSVPHRFVSLENIRIITKIETCTVLLTCSVP